MQWAAPANPSNKSTVLLLLNSAEARVTRVEQMQYGDERGVAPGNTEFSCGHGERPQSKSSTAGSKLGKVSVSVASAVSVAEID